MTSFYWVGYDSLILLLMVISLYKNKNYLIILICSIGIGLQHFEIGLVSIIVVAISSIIERIFYVNEKKIKISFVFKITFITGLIIGKIILYKIYNDESFVDGSLQWISDALLHLFTFYFNFITFLLSWCWLVNNNSFFF